MPHSAALRLAPGLLALVFCLFAGLAQAGSGKPFGLDDMLRVAMIDDVRVSADGKRTAFTVTRILPDQAGEELRSRIFLTDPAKGGARPVTSDQASCDKPRFSPDGSKLAYLLEGDAAADAVLLQLTTGQTRQLTHGRADVLDLAFSPDGKSLALLMSAAGKPSEQRPDCDADVEVFDSGDSAASLWLLPLTGTGPPRPLVTNRDVVSFAFSPNGRHIVFETTAANALPRGRRNVSATGQPAPVDAVHSDIALVEVATRTVRVLAATESSETTPVFSPDGAWVAYVATAAPGFYFNAARVMVAPAAGGQPRALAQTPDARPDLLGWSADGKSVLVREAEGVSAGILILPVDGSAPRRFSDTPHVVAQAGLSPGSRYLGLVLVDSDLPPEASVTPADRFDPRAVSAVNREFAGYRIAKAVPVRWQSSDGTTIEGLYTPPVTPVPGPPPLLVELHGGPAQAADRQYLGTIATYPLAVFSERGYALFQPNVRGSDGYGPEFRQAIVGDWGGVDFADLQTGIDHLVAQGLADAGRIGVMGWSYGGYLAAWAIGHTDRFAAASVGAGITNLTSLCGSMDLPDFIPLYFGGEAYERFDLLFARSPLKYAASVTTPTLFQHGVGDERVPFTQSLELYTALSRRGVVTQLAAYPRSGHDVTEPALIRDLMARNLDWFLRYVPVGGSGQSVTAPAEASGPAGNG